MGFYIEGPVKFKAAYICETHGAEAVTETEARQAFDEGKGVVCVVSNIPFDAAGFAYSKRELDEFADPRDERPKQWLVMDREKAEKLSGYSR